MPTLNYGSQLQDREGRDDNCKYVNNQSQTADKGYLPDIGKAIE